MKIIEFKTKDHPVLGDCSLDFSINGNFSNVVLIAGSNGSGKTTILNEVFDLLTNIAPVNRQYDVSVSFELTDEEVVLLKPVDNTIDNILRIDSLRIAPTGANWGQLKVQNSAGSINNNFLRNDIFRSMLKCVYSTVEINFANSQVASTTAKDIDSEKVPKEKSTANISQEITQLLVDIKALDNQDAADWVETNQDQTVQVLASSKRIGRFKKAFDSMIEGKTFEGVKNERDRKKVYFKDSLGNEIDISLLSSGEKQIVFRAGYLLKNIGSLSGGIVLIDEPEISLHPSWQEKYIEFVKKIFTDEQGVIRAQIIIATHSPFIIQNENISDEKVLVLEKNGKNTIESSWPKFYGYKQPEPIFVPVPDTIKPLLLLEGKSDKQIISCAWNKLHPGVELPFDIKWPNEPHTGGARDVQKQLNYFVQHGNQKVLGMYDSDQQGMNNFNGTSYKPQDFTASSNISGLKISGNVGVTYIPSFTGRDVYFNENPQLSFLVLEMYFSDTDLQSMGILSTPILFAGQSLIQIKPNHTIEDAVLESLPVESFKDFSVVFKHIENCFNEIP